MRGQRRGGGERSGSRQMEEKVKVSTWRRECYRASQAVQLCKLDLQMIITESGQSNAYKKETANKVLYTKWTAYGASCLQ